MTLQIDEKTEKQIYITLKAYYCREIKKVANVKGYRELSRNLGHNDNFINVVLRRDSFSALRRLYLDIKEM